MFCYVIGKGGFGKVWKVQYKKTKETFAWKEMSKWKIIDKKSEKSINSEREFLSFLNNPFIVNMHYAFQDKDNLYWVMDMLSGGDWRYHISRYHWFSEEQTRFFIACMVYSLEYIHNNNVIHRDIKPENLVLDDKGYVSITDFGIAKENMPDNSSETSGTPGYMSPEVMRGKNHSFPVDFFAIGVIGYEFMLGKRPYYGKSRKEIKELMLNKQAMIKPEQLKHGWSPESADFINKLLLRKPEVRLGFASGAKELKEHQWLKYYPWEELEKKTLPAPFIPEKSDNFDKRYCESVDKLTEETKMRYEEIMCGDVIKKAFSEFYYNKEEVKKNEKAEEEENSKQKDHASSNSRKANNSRHYNKENKNDENIELSTIRIESKVSKPPQKWPSEFHGNDEHRDSSSVIKAPPRSISGSKQRPISHSNSSKEIWYYNNKISGFSSTNWKNSKTSLNNPPQGRDDQQGLNNNYNSHSDFMHAKYSNDSNMNIFANATKNKFIYNFPKNSSSITKSHMRSSSVLNKNDIKLINNYNNIGTKQTSISSTNSANINKLNSMHLQAKYQSNNSKIHSNPWEQLYKKKKWNRDSSTSKILSRTSSDFILNKGSSTAHPNGYTSNYNTNNRLNYIK